MKEGMKGGTFGLACNPPPHSCDGRGGMGEAPVHTSSVFNEVVALHVHNQQEYKLVVDHEFVGILAWQWLWHAIVVRIGATKKERHFVVYIVFEDRWRLCDDARVKGEHPRPNSRKAAFLLYTRKPTAHVVPSVSQFASQRTRASASMPKGMPRACQVTPV